MASQCDVRCGQSCSLGVFIVFASGALDASVIKYLCEAGISDLLGYSRQWEAALRVISTSQPQVVIIDSRDAVDVSHRLLHAIWKSLPQVRTIVLTGDEKEAEAVKEGIEESVPCVELPGGAAEFKSLLRKLSGEYSGDHCTCALPRRAG